MSLAKMEHVTKEFHDFKALSDVSIEIKSGKIYGLIGENGAGKTTLMRILCGFTYPTNGSVSLFDQSEEKQLINGRKKIGCLIEYPALIPQMTAKENLHYHRLLRGMKEEDREDEVLDMVGLSKTGKKKAKDFSLGMKQRLGIAISLLEKPKFLILDEPINGLDPVGVVEIRNLLKELCSKYGITILISSHNLPELYQTATDYIIIHKGEIKQILSLEQLDEKCRHHIKIGCKDQRALCELLKDKLKTTNYTVAKDGMVWLYDYIDEVETVAKVIFEAGMYPTHFAKDGETLENYFLSVIGGE
ncbi:ABC transporter, ATP-binding protein [Lachnospiraceae bacterium KM106-2]|nr:ABC transporter, ATP-binding protein [Lachnospiraceae bacterium KM106-2]